MRKVLLLTLLAGFVFTLPAWAARYYYRLDIGTAVHGNDPVFSPSSLYWQSDTLLFSVQNCPTDGIDITKLPGFSGPTPTPTNLTVSKVVVTCIDQGQTPPLEIRIDFIPTALAGTCFGQPFPYPYDFFIETPEQPGFYSAQGQTFCGSEDIDDYNSSLTIIDSWSNGPPVTHLCPLCRKLISLRLVEGPVSPSPGGPVEATIQLTTLSGHPASAVRRVTLTAGRISSVDFRPEERPTSVGTFEDVIPVVNFVGAPATPPAVQITTESFDARTGEPNGPLITSGLSAPSSTLAPQSLGHGETMRLIARATSPNSCIATLSFSDAAGNPVGPMTSVNLLPGQAQTLELTLDSLPAAASLRAHKRFEILPAVQLTRLLPAASVARIPSVCSATAEVFNSATGVTATYQNAFLE